MKFFGFSNGISAIARDSAQIESYQIPGLKVYPLARIAIEHPTAFASAASNRCVRSESGIWARSPVVEGDSLKFRPSLLGRFSIVLLPRTAMKRPILMLLSALTLAASPLAATTAARANALPEMDERLVQLDLSPMDLNRAKNYARQAAEQFNGGLGEYRAEPAMHGPSRESPYEVNDDGTLTFTFLGRAPGASTYTVESVVTVDPETWDIDIEYNGSVRGTR
jgi:hypothetical protein